MTRPSAAGTTAATLRIALSGSPNVGKSTIFNILTGLHQHVGNWPGKTVERKTGTCRFDGFALQCVDLPGTYSLAAHSTEEVIARDYILNEKPDVVVVIIDAANIERNLYLVAQVLELTPRVVVALNMMDLAHVKHYRIFPEKLEQALGVPVVPLVAKRMQGIQDLLKAIVAVGTSERAPRPARIDYLRAEHCLSALRAILGDDPVAGYPSAWVALRLLEGDEEIEGLAADRVPPDSMMRVREVLRDHEHGPAVVADARYAWIERVLRSSMERPARSIITLTDRIDHIATHGLLGVPILLGIFILVFWLTFKASAPISDWIDHGFAHLGEWTTAALRGISPPLAGLLGGGVIAGLGGVLALLPVILIFFLFLAALEDSGYMARAAFVMDRMMHAMGLHGKAFLSLMAAYGCNIPGIMASRILESERDRVLVILVNPLIPCAARIGVAAFFVGALFPPHLRTPVMASLYALSLAMVILSGFVLRRVALPGERAPFMMELPLYRLPSARNLGVVVGFRLLAFLKKAGTVILAASVLIWVLSSFPPGASLQNTLMGRLGRFIAPVGGLCGLDWRMTIALLTGVAAKETSLAALGVLYHAEGAALSQALRGSVTPLVGLVFVVVQMLYIPCLATAAVIRSETGSWKWTAVGVSYPLVVAGALGALVFHVGRILGLR